jgi:hypothetical protein
MLIRTLLLAVVLLLPAACRDAPPPDEPVGAARVEVLRLQCERGGGRFAPAGPGGLLACVREHPDAGRQCSRSGDCAGACLARSGTCAPISPLFGCHEVLQQDGRRITQCLE